VRYGFVIDQDRCIGCHACTVACKEEHNVPIGVFRTWVKYIEKGEFPNAARHFGVMRCNHCGAAPCIEICPTAALLRRDNGIVDFDSARCIGCKSCMQACPYDALYIDPVSHTAAKCNFCAHRVERKLEPACVIVCPTQAIIAGDLDDAGSRASRTIATRKVVARKPHKGTRPNLYYVGIDGDLLEPTAPAERPSHVWSDRQPAETPHAPSPGYRETRSGARVVYDVAHPAPWGWKIGAYLVTKSIAAGALMVAAILLALGFRDETLLLGIASPAIAMAFLGATAVLLIADLKRPDRFYFLLTRPNPRSWVVIGAYILIVYGGAAFLWLAAAAFTGLPPPLLVWIGALLAICAAAYTGYLFAQARGRDLWQSPLFTWHLIVQALVAGASALLIAGIAIAPAAETIRALAGVLAIALVLSAAMILGEITLAPSGEDVHRAIALLTRGALSTRFFGGAMALGIAAPLVLLAISARVGFSPALDALASAAALAGLWHFESVWIEAGQSVPLS
jgi:Fe-S-cluster-containing dehydrogenase component/formate-dependent nitrite reductase membrane component NrfD